MSWHDVYIILEDSMPLNSLYVKAATILENTRPAFESSWVSSVFRPLEPRELANATRHLEMILTYFESIEFCIPSDSGVSPSLSYFENPAGLLQ